ncbi:MAG: hypothetical protein HYY13_08320, partial [Nitrospirae bacterium]|nr:hypothetical protein [Nitrospirota bacterium]
MKRDSLPLYGTERLRDVSGPIVLVEGEKAADALNAAGVRAVGSVTGASGTPTDEVLRSLAGRDVYLWPDNDDEGRAHLERIAAGLVRIGGRVHVIEWAGAKEKGDDAADFFFRGGTAEQVREMEAKARPWERTVTAGRLRLIRRV